MSNKESLIIVAAGVGSRMQSGNLPKALVKITDEPNMTNTLRTIGSKDLFDNIYIIANSTVYKEWDAWYDALDPKLVASCGTINIVYIRSGLGDGHALLEGLKIIEPMLVSTRSMDVVVAWGDVFFRDDKLIKEMLNHSFRSMGLIPMQAEKEPYVNIVVKSEEPDSSGFVFSDTTYAVCAEFSKLGESMHKYGYHDQSVFMFPTFRLIEALNTLHAATWKNGKYITQNGELSTLFLFHYFNNVGRPMVAYLTEFGTLSFNTTAEVAEIQAEIKNSWGAK